MGSDSWDCVQGGNINTVFKETGHERVKWIDFRHKGPKNGGIFSGAGKLSAI